MESSGQKTLKRSCGRLGKSNAPRPIFNTTILESKVFIELSQYKTNGKPRNIGWTDINGTWRYIYNKAVDEMIRSGFLDCYGRITVLPNRLKEKFLTIYRRNGKSLYEYRDLGECLKLVFIEEGVLNLPEWCDVYSTNILAVPLYQIAKALSSGCEIVLHYRKKLTTPQSYIIPVSAFHSDRDRCIEIVDDIKEGHSFVSIHDINRFDNDIKFIIYSNTANLDQHLDTICDERTNPDDISIMIGTTKMLHADGKLLCTIIIDTKGENER